MEILFLLTINLFCLLKKMLQRKRKTFHIASCSFSRLGKSSAKAKKMIDEAYVKFRLEAMCFLKWFAMPKKFESESICKWWIETYSGWWPTTQSTLELAKISLSQSLSVKSFQMFAKVRRDLNSRKMLSTWIRPAFTTDFSLFDSHE